MEKILYFENAGMFHNNNYFNDLNACRIRTAFKNDNGDLIYIELMQGKKFNIRNTHKITGKPLKKTIIETITENALICDFCHYITPDKDDCNESRINTKTDELFYFTDKDITRFVNRFCNCSFDGIQVLLPFSGYNVHKKTENGFNKCFLQDDFVYNPDLALKRFYTYKIVARDYFNTIYQAHNVNNKFYHYSDLKYGAHSVIEYDDSKIVLRSHAYADIINDSEREKIFNLSDIDLIDALKWFNNSTICY